MWTTRETATSHSARLIKKRLQGYPFMYIWASTKYQNSGTESNIENLAAVTLTDSIIIGSASAVACWWTCSAQTANIDQFLIKTVANQVETAAQNQNKDTAASSWLDYTYLLWGIWDFRNTGSNLSKDWLMGSYLLPSHLYCHTERTVDASGAPNQDSSLIDNLCR